MRALRDLLFPPVCLACLSLGEPFCDACCAEVQPAEGFPTPPGIADIRALGVHTGPLRRAVLRLKFERRAALAAPLGRLLAQRLDEAAAKWRPDSLTPVPLHWSRTIARGYNQSALLAQEIGTTSGVPVIRALTRRRATRSQVGLSGEERAVNLKDAIALRRGVTVRGLRLVVVDDVCTTGATLAACAAALRSAGAAEVFALTLSRD